MVKRMIINEFVKDNIKKYILGILALILSSFLTLAMPKILGYIVDMLRDKKADISIVYKWIVFMFIGGILLFILKYFMRYFIMGKARDLECFMRAKLFSHLQTLPPYFYNNKKTGDLMAYAINDLSAIRAAFSFGIVFFIDGIIINLFSLVVMVKSIDLFLTLIAIWPIIFAVFLTIKLRKGIRKRFTKVQEAYSDISDNVQENLSGIRVVKAFVQEKSQIKKMRDKSQRRMDAQVNYVKLSGFLGPSVQICFGIAFSMVLIYGSKLVVNGRITLGDFVAFNSYLAMLTVPITHVGKIVEVWQRAIASIKRLDDIFNYKTDIVDEDIKFIGDKLEGNIVIKDLNFSYPDGYEGVLENININLEKGKTLAIIGKTGSGKTTLMNILLRLYKIDRGHVFIDGYDINDISISTLRNNFGYVTQDNFLFSTTIRENIQFFNNDYDYEEVEEAAKLSDIYKSIMDFKEGFDTVVGERGVTLSGGQKQRIAIARAIIKDPSILILDDSLSAVDTRTEETILSNIKEVLKGRTGIIISHRISTIRHADEIIILDNGKIIERGKHSDLITLGGYYYKLYCAQAAEKSISEIREETAI